MNALISCIDTFFYDLKGNRELQVMVLRAALAYWLVVLMIYCSTEVIRNSWKYWIGVALRESGMFTLGFTENVSEVGGNGSASVEFYENIVTFLLLYHCFYT